MSVPDTGSEDLARTTLEALSAPNMRSTCLKLLSGALACLRLAHRILAGMPHMPTPCASDAASPSCCVAALVEAEWERSDLPARQQRHFPLAHYYPCLATFRSEMATFSNCRMGFSIFSVLSNTYGLRCRLENPVSASAWANTELTQNQYRTLLGKTRRPGSCNNKSVGKSERERNQTGTTASPCADVPKQLMKSAPGCSLHVRTVGTNTDQLKQPSMQATISI